VGLSPDVVGGTPPSLSRGPGLSDTFRPGRLPIFFSEIARFVRELVFLVRLRVWSGGESETYLFFSTPSENLSFKFEF